MAALDSSALSIKKKELHQPQLEEIAEVLQKGLVSNFNEVLVTVVDCPDLTKDPFYLASSGLSGNTSLLEIGGTSYLLPLVQKDKLYDVKEIVDGLPMEKALVIGAGAGPWPHVGMNCEGVYNLFTDSGKVLNKTRIATVDKTTQEFTQHELPTAETRCALLANLYLSEGNPGRVVKVHCKKRTGSDDFITSIRLALEAHFTNDLVGLGGTFLLKEGKAKQHVMRDFSKTPINTEEEINEWLAFYDMEAPLVAVGTLVTQVTELDLRVQHFHSFSNHGDAGHYHIDTTPDTVEYLGYFNVGQRVIRVDQPLNANLLGRD